MCMILILGVGYVKEDYMCRVGLENNIWIVSVENF